MTPFFFKNGFSTSAQDPDSPFIYSIWTLDFDIHNKISMVIYKMNVVVEYTKRSNNVL